MQNSDLPLTHQFAVGTVLIDHGASGVGVVVTIRYHDAPGVRCPLPGRWKHFVRRGEGLHHFNRECRLMAALERRMMLQV